MILASGHNADEAIVVYFILATDPNDFDEEEEENNFKKCKTSMKRIRTSLNHEKEKHRKSIFHEKESKTKTRASFPRNLSFPLAASQWLTTLPWNSYFKLHSTFFSQCHSTKDKSSSWATRR
eukprot:g32124.t1